LQITPQIISQFVLKFSEKSPEKLMHETTTIGNLVVGDLVINWGNLESLF
jgi:hypothetical protein